MPPAKTLVSYLPSLIFAGVMLWRLRAIERARPVRLRAMWILPAVFAVLVALVFASMPPTPFGIAALLLGMGVGAVAGWQRARLVRLHVEGEGKTARVLMRQSPAALLLLMVIAALRSVFRSAASAAPNGTGQISVAAMTLTDALLGFALAMIVAQRVALWRRARELIAEEQRER